jgi:hypothetical protein
MTPQPDASDPRRLANVHRVVWHNLMADAAAYHLDREQALDLTTAVIELTKLGYTLTADETDWQPQQPPSTAGE